MNNHSKITGTSAPLSDPRKPERACVPQSLTIPDDGYGLQPRCITCRKGMSNCLCDAPDIDVPSVHDMRRIYPSLFADDEDAALVYVDRISPTRIAL